VEADGKGKTSQKSRGYEMGQSPGAIEKGLREHKLIGTLLSTEEFYVI
jgi:hypothetical protein